MNALQITVDIRERFAVEPSQDAITWLVAQPFLGVLLGLMVLDIITGIISAFVTKELCSSASFRGMLKKSLMLGMVATGYVVQIVAPQLPWGEIIAVFFIFTEAISITENVGDAGVPIPQQWLDALKRFKQKEADRTSPSPVHIEVNAKTANISESQTMPVVKVEPDPGPPGGNP